MLLANGILDFTKKNIFLQDVALTPIMVIVLFAVTNIQPSQKLPKNMVKGRHFKPNVLVHN